MPPAPRLAIGTPVFVTWRGRWVCAEIAGYKESPKGLFYVTQDAAGVERKARPAHVSLDQPPAVTLEPPPPAARRSAPPPAPRIAPPRAAWEPPLKPRVAAIKTMPDWPRGMPTALAAAYCGVSETLLEAQGIRSTRLSAGRKVYLREHLDAWLDAKDGRTPVVAPEEFDWEAVFETMRETNSEAPAKRRR